MSVSLVMGICSGALHYTGDGYYRFRYVNSFTTVHAPDRNGPEQGAGLPHAVRLPQPADTIYSGLRRVVSEFEGGKGRAGRPDVSGGFA